MTREFDFELFTMERIVGGCRGPIRVMVVSSFLCCGCSTEARVARRCTEEYPEAATGASVEAARQECEVEGHDGCREELISGMAAECIVSGYMHLERWGEGRWNADDESVWDAGCGDVYLTLDGRFLYDCVARTSLIYNDFCSDLTVDARHASIDASRLTCTRQFP